MTVTYQSKVTSASSCAFGKLLGKWKGSIYKLVYKELFFYGFCYAVISLTYRHLLAHEEKRQFEKICVWVEDTVEMIPLTFVLGFYVSFVVQRWWDQFLNIPWPDRATAAIALYVDGNDEGGRLIRRTMARYLNLSFILVAQSVSVAVRKRFPTILHLEDAGLLTHEETETLRNLTSESNKYWVPISWLIAVLRKAKRDGRIKDPLGSKAILEEVNSFRKHTSTLWCYDWVSVPLVYTQVVTWATHLFFIACLLGRQILDPTQDFGNVGPGRMRPRVDVYVPVFTLLQFLFYMGWLKVAEQLINPFGEDDDDLEINYLIDRHLQVSYLAVDELFDTHPDLVKDQFWSEQNPVRLPYSASTLRYRKKSYLGSAWDIRLNEESSLPAQHLIRIPEESSEYEMHSLLKNAQSMPYLAPQQRKDESHQHRSDMLRSPRKLQKVSTASMATPSQHLDNRVPQHEHHDHESHHINGFVHGRWSVAASHLLTMWRKISMSRSTPDPSHFMGLTPDASSSPATHDLNNANFTPGSSVRNQEDLSRQNSYDAEQLPSSTQSQADNDIQVHKPLGVVGIVVEGAGGDREPVDVRPTTGHYLGAMSRLSVSGAESPSFSTPPTLGRRSVRRKYSIQHAADYRHHQHPILKQTDDSSQPHQSHLPGTCGGVVGKKVSFPALPSVSPIPERPSFSEIGGLRHIDDYTSSEESEDK